MNFGIGTNVVIAHVNSLNKKDPPTAFTVLAVNVPLLALLLYRMDDLLNISLPERYICAKGQDTQVSAAAVLIKDKPISLPERYICAKGQDTQVSAAAVLIKDKPMQSLMYFSTEQTVSTQPPCLSTEQQVQQQLR